LQVFVHRHRWCGQGTNPAFLTEDFFQQQDQGQVARRLFFCEEGWSFIAEWYGVQLSYLLNLVGASPKAKWVVVYPLDDFWGCIRKRYLHTV
jgi:DMSO/TMAO reductase YedYZ molybdopterin-dependent catalytic subunit